MLGADRPDVQTTPQLFGAGSPSKEGVECSAGQAWKVGCNPMTPLQKYRHALAEQGIELTPAQFLEARAKAFQIARRAYVAGGVRCPTHDDVFEEWLLKRGTNPYPPEIFGEISATNTGD